MYKMLTHAHTIDTHIHTHIYTRAHARTHICRRQSGY
jgi:hypothetical protein